MIAFGCLAIILMVAGFLWSTSKPTTPQAEKQDVPVITTKSDLEEISQDLDNTDFSQIDKSLEELGEKNLGF